MIAPLLLQTLAVNCRQRVLTLGLRWLCLLPSARKINSASYCQSKLRGATVNQLVHNQERL